MRACVIAIAALLTVSGPALAEPAKNAADKTAPQQRPAEVVLASADSVHATAPDAVPQQPPVPAKRRIARVTTCRCGDPQVDPENPEQ
jgi:hypothetical protein